MVSAQSRTRAAADHAGLSLPSDALSQLISLNMILLLPMLSSNWLTVLALLRTMDAMEDFHPRPSSTSPTTEELRERTITLTLLWMAHAFPPPASTDSVSKLVHITSQLEMRRSSNKLSTSSQYLSPSRLLMASVTTHPVSIPQPLVETPSQMLTTLSWLLATELTLILDFHTGLLKTHGVLNGVTKDSSRSKEVLICAELPCATHIQMV